jgi:hypothetical protein
VIAAGGTVIDHEIVAAFGFDHITEWGEGFLGQRFDLECAHAVLVVLIAESKGGCKPPLRLSDP